MVTVVKAWGTAALALAGVLVAGAAYVVARPAGSGYTDDWAAEIAERIAYPAGPDADSYARSALKWNDDQERFAILEITDRPTTSAEEARVSLVFRLHDPGTSDDPPYTWRLWEREPVTACYRADFNRYGVVGEPSRVHCPADAMPVVPPPAPRTGVPAEYTGAVEKVLAELPPAPTAEEVLAALRAGLPPLPVDAETGLPWIEPRLDAAVRDGEVGVVAAGGGQCLNGVRLRDGTTAAWYPPRVQTQPGEIGCSGEGALTLYRTPPPK